MEIFQLRQENATNHQEKSTLIVVVVVEVAAWMTTPVSQGKANSRKKTVALSTATEQMWQPAARQNMSV